MSDLPFGRAEELFHRALEVPAAERLAHLEEWCRNDAALLGEVRSLLDGYANARDTTPREFPEPRIAAAGPYRIERLIGKGGTGAVYVASRSDGEFRMQAAVKVLASRITGVATHERFQLERQILASLNHPNIARLLDGGVTPAGEAYLVMEYIEGEPLDVWVARRALGVTGVLRLFLLVCGAVEHAHRNLILHRDLKPGNILVTAEGQPKVLDFGNAKLLGEGSPGDRRLTQLGGRAFTPEFAAPEQVLGGAVSASCDVYSLGVVLYGLLAGRPPYRFETWSSAEFVHVFRDFDPPPPGSQAPRGRISADLDAIVMKALAKTPANRYPAIADFAADIRAVLEFRPVSARVWSLTYRARKFLARHRRGVAATGTIVALLLTGVAATAWQAHRAHLEERRAYAQFRTARELSRSLLSDFYEAVQELPGSLDVQHAMVAESARYVDRLWSESPGDAEAAIDAIEAYLKLGNLQGNPYSDNLADPGAALRTLEKARGMAAALGPWAGQPRVGRLLGLAEQSIGEVLYGKHDIESAARHLTEAIRIFERIAGMPPVNAPALIEAASACGSLGDVYAHGNGPADAAKAQSLFEKQKALDERALTIAPASERASRGIAVAGLKLAGLIEETQPADAAHLLEGGLQRLATLPEAPRRSMSNLRLAAILQTHLARAYPAIGDHAAGTEHASQAVRLYESIAAMSPGNARAQADLLDAWFSYAESVDYGDTTPSAELLEQIRSAYHAALDLCDDLLKSAPGNLQWIGRAAEIQFRIGRISFAMHDAAGARAALERAHALAIAAASRPDAGESDLLAAAIQFSSEDVPGAWRDLARARSYLDRLIAQSDSPSAHQLYTAARIARLQGRTAEAAELVLHAESVLPAVAPGQPKSYLRRQIEEEKARDVK